MTAQMYVPRFYIRQKFAMTTNRYEIIAANPDGSEGPLMAVAQQKRLALWSLAVWLWMYAWSLRFCELW